MNSKQSALSPKTKTGANLTRRGILRGAAGAVAAASLSRISLFAEDSVSPPMARLSSYMSEARNHALPDDVTEKAKHHILDTFAAMVSGSELVPGQAALKFARNYGGEKIATVICSNILCGPMEAALVNGVLGHSDETDDAHAPSGSHPGVAIVPAALAVGEKFGISGAEFLRAITLGYDVGTRFVMTMGGAAIQSEQHRSTHSIAGIFGAAAAAASAASLNEQQMRWVLDYTSQQSSGTAAWQRDTQHIEKGFVYAGMPARGGVTSALLVQSGWTGVDDVLSGADNFFMAYAPQSNPASLVDKLGERFAVTETDIKKWTVGAPIQAVLDAVDILIKRRSFSADDVKEVVVRLARTQGTVVNNREMPDICVQHMVAVMLIDKSASFKSAHDKARMQDPAVLRVRAKVNLVLDDGELQRALPRREAIVEITLNDGTRLNEHVKTVRGGAANAMTREEVVAKARELMVPVLGAANGSALIEKMLNLENVKSVQELRPLLQLV
ncbi:MAG TPA: MmgE/PrpD family protein [Candidatus Acidoferrales bacterium]|jgi:2-methylcitrate dehydratase PrpD|nr:MmgE/PrpD family protein [Candidatus Acidoferrales bacterium]